MMADLYGVGCVACHREIAAAVAELPHMPGYLDAQGYNDRYRSNDMPLAEWPKPYVDGEYKAGTFATVCGDDGWLICHHERGRLCRCGAEAVEYELWRGKVEIR